MDTKTLYDWANEAGLNFKSDDPADAEQVWIDNLVSDPTWLDDVWLDFLVDMMEKPADKPHIKESDFDIFVQDLKRAHQNREDVFRVSRSSGTTYLGNSAVALTSALAHMGEMIYRAILKGATKLVEDNASEWWGDVCSYDYEMREGQYEDYKYEQWKDRQLERRYDEN